MAKCYCRWHDLTRMRDFSLDKALELASSLLSFGFDAVSRGIQSSALVTGIHPHVIVACAGGFLVFIVAIKLLPLK
jgi:uncharacterized membrane-anchored protein